MNRFDAPKTRMPIPTQRQNKEGQMALRQAWDSGLLDPLYFHPEILNWQPPEPDPVVADMLYREPPTRPRNDRITDQLDEPARDTRAQLYQDNSWFIEAAPFQPGAAYEVARFITDGSETGFVKMAWTYAEVSDGAGGIIELDPRDPFAVQRALAPGVDVLWFVRLQQGQFQETIPAPLVAPVANVPGYGFSPLYEWRDYRFQWGRTQTNVFWLVPQYHALRLYFVVESQAAVPLLLRVGGRLAGYTQPNDVRVTGWNVTHGY